MMKHQKTNIIILSVGLLAIATLVVVHTFADLLLNDTRLSLFVAGAAAIGIYYIGGQVLCSD